MALRGGSARTLLSALAIASFLLAAWFLWPSEARDAPLRPPVRVVLVDASDSLRRTRPDWLPWVRRALVEEARAASERGEELAVVSFAAEVATRIEPAEPARLTDRLLGRSGELLDPRVGAGAGGETRLAAALRVAHAVCTEPGRAPGTVVVLGTEATTGEDPAPFLMQLARGGVRIEHRAAPPPEYPDLAVLEVALPARIEAGAPLSAVARLRYEPGRTPLSGAVLDVEIRNASTARSLSLPAELPAAGGRIEVTVPCGEAGFGRTEVRVRVRSPSEGPAAIDPVPENDRATGSVHAGGELVVLVAAEEDRLDAAREWLTPSGSSALVGVQFLFVAAGEVAAPLASADALITFDVALRELPEKLVGAFVEAGGGWLATSGWRFLEDWVPRGDTGPDAGETGLDRGLHRLLPLEPAPLEHGPRDVVLLVDGSGSMAGAPFETVRSAALDLVAAALPSDEVGLRFFTARLRTPSVIKPRTDGADADHGLAAEAARRLLALHVPAGETYILASLEQLAAERAALEREALVLLLTDGLEREAMADPEARAARVRAALADARVTLRPIAIGERADLDFLRLLVEPGRRVSRPTGLDELRALFRREISGAQWRAGPALRLARERAPSGGLDPVVESLVAAAEAAVGDPLPVVRFVKNVPRPGARVLLRGDRREPVLALTRVGLGRTALFASQPGAGWAPAWTGRRGMGEPAELAGLLRWLGRGPRRDSESLAVRIEGARWSLHGLDDRWPARVDGELFAGAGREARAVRAVRLYPRATGAGGDPLAVRSGALPSELLRREIDAPFLRVVAPEGGEVWLPLERGLAEEYAGGGTPFDPSPWGATRRGREDAGPRRPRPRTAQARWPAAGAWALAAGMAALFCAFLPRAAED